MLSDLDRAARERLEELQVDIGGEHATGFPDPSGEPLHDQAAARADLGNGRSRPDAQALEQRERALIPEPLDSREALALVPPSLIVRVSTHHAPPRREAKPIRDGSPVLSLLLLPKSGSGFAPFWPPVAGADSGPVQQSAVIKALAEADRPMSVGEAHAAVEELLGHPVSRDSLCSCLSPVPVRRGSVSSASRGVGPDLNSAGLPAEPRVGLRSATIARPSRLLRPRQRGPNGEQRSIHAFHGA